MRTSAQITEDIRAFAPSLRICRTRGIAIRKMIEERQPKVEFALTVEGIEADPEHVDNAKGHPFHIIKGPIVEELIGLEYALKTLEATATYQEAVAALDPLHAELEQALAAEVEQARIVSELENRVAAALEEAERKALAGVAKDSAVEKARKELEKAAGRLRTSAEIAADIPPEPTTLERYHGAESPGIERVNGPQDEEDAAAELAADLH